LAMDRNKWTHLVKYVVDTNGHWAHGARERDFSRKWWFSLVLSC